MVAVDQHVALHPAAVPPQTPATERLLTRSMTVHAPLADAAHLRNLGCDDPPGAPSNYELELDPSLGFACHSQRVAAVGNVDR
jgi:hypothetical protein